MLSKQDYIVRVLSRPRNRPLMAHNRINTLSLAVTLVVVGPIAGAVLLAGVGTILHPYGS